MLCCLRIRSSAWRACREGYATIWPCRSSVTRPPPRGRVNSTTGGGLEVTRSRPFEPKRTVVCKPTMIAAIIYDPSVHPYSDGLLELDREIYETMSPRSWTLLFTSKNQDGILNHGCFYARACRLQPQPDDALIKFERRSPQRKGQLGEKRPEQRTGCYEVHLSLCPFALCLSRLLLGIYYLAS